MKNSDKIMHNDVISVDVFSTCVIFLADFLIKMSDLTTVSPTGMTSHNVWRHTPPDSIMFVEHSSRIFCRIDCIDVMTNPIGCALLRHRYCCFIMLFM